MLSEFSESRITVPRYVFAWQLLFYADVLNVLFVIGLIYSVAHKCNFFNRKLNKNMDT
jgi:hypothetical protein